MAKRTASRQTKHDTKVRQIARQLQGQGYKVRADLPGYPSPTPIGKGRKVPDIQAKKGGRCKIIEVETPETVERDKEQHNAFRRSAAQKSNTSFKIEVAE
ncbi:MAG: hypothetical protein WBH01_05675 [Dehalococcoidia bacterium]